MTHFSVCNLNMYKAQHNVAACHNVQTLFIYCVYNTHIYQIYTTDYTNQARIYRGPAALPLQTHVLAPGLVKTGQLQVIPTISKNSSLILLSINPRQFWFRSFRQTLWFPQKELKTLLPNTSTPQNSHRPRLHWKAHRITQTS